MAEKQYPTQYFSFEETVGKTLASYVCLDPQGREITINPKNPAKHESYHPLQNDPTVHYNLHMAILHPDSVVPSPSQNPKSIQQRLDGDVMIYKKKGFVEALNLPGEKHGDIEVVVKYQDPAKHSDPKNFTLTYMIRS